MTGPKFKSRIEWEGRSWRLRVVEARTAGGSIHERGIIDHPGSVVIIPVENQQIFMLRQYRLALDETILELPAGTRELGEDWLDCARRELREETGYRAEIWKFLGKVWPAPGITNELMVVYLATELSPDPLPADEDEEIEVQPLPFDDLISMAFSGELKDAKSVVGILRAAAHLKYFGV